MSHSRCVSVIIAAHNARTTIGNAIISALDQNEVSEVIVVDDASTDETADAATEAGGGESRLKILRSEINIGPAAARNLAIRHGTAPYIAVLDADDRFVPGRLGRLLKFPDWDMAADDIAFFSGAATSPPQGTNRTETLDLVRFVQGNLTGQRGDRGELGFLKPVIRREFLETQMLSYDEGIRLGEDYDLYVRCLQKGARFVLSHRVGYLAEIRANSLSSRHTTEDLANLLAATERHLATETDADARRAMALLSRQIRNRWLLRQFLDRKATRGRAAALAFAFAPPTRLAPIARGIWADKVRNRTGGDPPTRTTLLSVSDA